MPKVPKVKVDRGSTKDCAWNIGNLSGETLFCLSKISSDPILHWRCEAEPSSSMELIKKLRIDNDLGLHARAAAKIVELSKQYESELFLRRDDEEVDGASILSILTLACPKGTEVEVRAVGDDSEELLEKLSELFKGKFGEKK